MLSTSQKQILSDELSSALGERIRITSFEPIGGGCINHGGKLTTSSGNYFVKWNNASKYPGMFSAEAKGLDKLRAVSALNIPGVIWSGESAGDQYLVLSLVNAGKRRSDYWELLGQGLADLHRITSPSFGLDYDNYIGSLNQSNKAAKSWIDFFVRERIERQLILAEGNGRIPDSIRKKFETLYKKLPTIVTDEPPSLIHGDLWSGNVMVNEKGCPALIDPAVSFGHREADLAMTRLFGGFHQSFYDSYSNEFPTEPGLENRIEIYTLYPLLVHVNLFGGSYLNQVNAILRKFA
jgi:protein-ribulosamine 3-kinase